MMKTKINKICIIILLVIALLLLIVSSIRENNVIETMSIQNWGLSFQEKNTSPAIDVEEAALKEAGAYHLGNEEEKKIYLTFDAGFENGNTEKILEALGKHQVKACFFLVGNYLEKEPELVKKMIEEGHIIGNHTYNHKDMSTLTEKNSFLKELTDLEQLYFQVTGKEINKYYRPPQGKYSMEQLNWAKEAGYKSIFWSLAYVDWEVENQPSHEEAIQKLKERIHPGAIVLLHSTSKTNGEIMDELLQEWKDMGYTFGTLDELM